GCYRRTSSALLESFKVKEVEGDHVQDSKSICGQTKCEGPKVTKAQRLTTLDMPPLSGVKPCCVGPSSSSDNTELINNLDAGIPLHIQTNDNSNITLIPFKLLGTENYRI
ncbi:hypothetical protein Tco_1442601, partial [Tanacetum coccineum]